MEGHAIKLSAGVDRCTALGQSVLTRTVEILESKADRICQCMTSRTNRIFAVDRQPLARGLGRCRVLELGKVDVARWIRNLLAQQNFANSAPSPSWRAATRMGVLREEADLCQDAGSGIIRLELIGNPALNANVDGQFIKNG